VVTEELTERVKAKRERIHLAAQSIFMRQGFEAASMDAIAAMAGVSKPTLYRYYHNKEALFIATLHQLMLEHSTSTATFNRLQQTQIESPAILEQALVVWGQVVLENALQPAYLALVRVLISEIPRFPSLSTLFSSAIPQEGRAILIAILENAVANDVVAKTLNLDVAVRLFVGGLLTYVLSGLFRPVDKIPAPSTREVTALVQLFLKSIVNQAQVNPHQ